KKALPRFLHGQQLLAAMTRAAFPGYPTTNLTRQSVIGSFNFFCRRMMRMRKNEQPIRYSSVSSKRRFRTNMVQKVEKPTACVKVTNAISKRKIRQSGAANSWAFAMRQK